MHGNRKWFLLGGALRGPIEETYHYLDLKNNITACGIKLQFVYGRFVNLNDTLKQINNKKCKDCLRKRK